MRAAPASRPRSMSKAGANSCSAASAESGVASAGARAASMPPAPRSTSMSKALAEVWFAASAEDGVVEGVPRMGGWLRSGSAASRARLDVLQDAAPPPAGHGADDPCRVERKKIGLTQSYQSEQSFLV